MGRAAAELEHAIAAPTGWRRGATWCSDHTIAGPVHAAQYPGLPVVATNHNPVLAHRDGDLLDARRAAARSSRSPIARVDHRPCRSPRSSTTASTSDFPDGIGGEAATAMLTRMTPDKGIDRAMPSRPARRGAACASPRRCASRANDEYFDERDPAAPRRRRRVPGRGRRRRASASCWARPLALLNPIDVGRTVRHGDGRGDGVRHARWSACPGGAAPEIVVDGVTGFLAAERRRARRRDRAGARARPIGVPRARRRRVLRRPHVRALRRRVRA